MEHRASVRLVVLGDSLAFTDHVGPQLPEHPALYPNVVARRLEQALQRPVELSVLARAGADVRDAWRMVTKDRHAQFEVLRGADATVVAISSFDHAPAGVPPVVEEVVRYLRPAVIRRRSRAALHRLHPVVAAVTGSRVGRTPSAEFVRLYDRLLLQVRGLTGGAAGVVMGPTSHRSRYYGPGHPNRASREAAQFAVAARHAFATVACWPLVEPHAARLNPDGIHWPHEAHAAVGEALAAPLVNQLKGLAPKPEAPRWG